MYIYDCPVIGSGTEYDPFRPSIADEGAINEWQVYGQVPINITSGMRIQITTKTPISLPDVSLVKSI